MRNPSHLNLYPMNRALLCYMIFLGNQRRGLQSGEETEVELRWGNKIGRERTVLLSLLWQKGHENTNTALP